MVAPHSSEPLNGDRENIINHIVTMWFTQGGEAQFGMLGRPTNENELVAAILSIVRPYIQAEHDGLKARIEFTKDYESVKHTLHKLETQVAILPSVRADETGHMYRCAKVNGVWVCHDDCAMPKLESARAANHTLMERIEELVVERIKEAATRD